MAETEREGQAMTSDYNLAEQMRNARLQAGLTQVELAKLMYTKQPMIARWETGVTLPGIQTLDKLAEVTGRKLEVRFV
jgi:transcriptional regulator with XRE-family HTH domain